MTASAAQQLLLDGIPPVEERRSRIQWDPVKSSHLEDTMNALVARILTGEISPEIRPTTLLELGHPFKHLYFAGFCHRHERAAWAEERFPPTPDDRSGFSSFVLEINRRLASAGFVAANSKLMSIHHTGRERETILLMQERYLRGEIERAAATRCLLVDHDIELSPMQEQFYFGAQRVAGPDRGPLEVRAAALLKRVRAIQEELVLDLTDIECLKGIAFENLVGVFLAETLRGTPVTAQRRLTCAYRDLDGDPHHSVYVDYFLPQRAFFDAHVVEVKWQNSLENILTSVLPQLHALERATGKQQRAVVICRNLNPDMKILMDENLSVLEEAVRMGLDEIGRSARDLIHYTTFESLISDLENSARYMDTLRTIDRLVDAGDIKNLKALSIMLDRIRRNGENVAPKLAFAQEAVSQNVPISRKEFNDLFGPPRGGIEDDRRGTENRIKILQHSALKAGERLLAAVLRAAGGPMVDRLDEGALSALEALDVNTLTAACLKVFEEKKAAADKRLEAGRERRKAYDPAREVLRIYSRLQQRSIETRHAEDQILANRLKSTEQKSLFTRGYDLSTFPHYLTPRELCETLNRMLPPKHKRPTLKEAAEYREIAIAGEQSALKVIIKLFDPYLAELALGRDLDAVLVSEKPSIRISKDLREMQRALNDSVQSIGSHPVNGMLTKAQERYPHSEQLRRSALMIDLGISKQLVAIFERYQEVVSAQEEYSLWRAHKWGTSLWRNFKDYIRREVSPLDKIELMQPINIAIFLTNSIFSLDGSVITCADDQACARQRTGFWLKSNRSFTDAATRQEYVTQALGPYQESLAKQLKHFSTPGIAPFSSQGYRRIELSKTIGFFARGAERATAQNVRQQSAALLGVHLNFLEGDSSLLFDGFLDYTISKGLRNQITQDFSGVLNAHSELLFQDLVDRGHVAIIALYDLVAHVAFQARVVAYFDCEIASQLLQGISAEILALTESRSNAELFQLIPRLQEIAAEYDARFADLLRTSK